MLTITQIPNHNISVKAQPCTRSSYVKTITGTNSFAHNWEHTDLQKYKRIINVGIVTIGCVLSFPFLCLLSWYKDLKHENPDYPV